MDSGQEISYKPFRVLVACEFSGIVRDAFRARGCDAWSCDYEWCESFNAFHYRGDVFDIINHDWDLMIAHPPCTHLAVSGAHAFWYKEKEQAEAIAFVRRLMAAPILRIAIENPVSILSTAIRKPDQVFEPCWFGEPEKKKTCLWLKNLDKLKPTNIVEATKESILAEPPGPQRQKNRSRTFKGVAEAMAAQWYRPHWRAKA